MKIDFKSSFPYILPVVLIVIINIIYFIPQFEGKVVRQGDIVQYQGMAKEAMDYKAKTGEEALWTNSMFGGMPTYQITAKPKNNLLRHGEKVLSLFFSRPAGYFIAGMIGFYLMMLLLGVNPWLSFIGALFFGFTTNNFILFGAGHNSKLMAIMTSAPVIAGIIMVFREKYLLGTAIFGIAFGMNIAANHPQMTYYLGLCLAVLVIIYFVDALKKNKIKEFCIAMGLLIGVSILSVGASASKLWTTYEYTKSTMRGGQILKNDDMGTHEATAKGGLEWDYAMQWSNGFGDVMATFIPKVVGGGSGEWLDGKSVLGKAVGQRQPFQFGTYFGDLPFTSGPAYFGIIAFFLFVLGLFTVKGKLKWWLIGVVVLTMLMSMGKHFGGFNKLLFDYLPMYNKFRAPSSILSVTAIFIPILGILGLSEVFKAKDKSIYLKPLLITTGIVGGISLFVWLFGTSMFNLSMPIDDQYPQIKDAVLDQRADMISSSAMRSLFFVILAAGVLYLFIKNIISSIVMISIVGLLGLVDLVQIGSGYFGKRDFVTERAYKNEFEPRKVDLQILEDKDPNFRVMDVTVNTFNSAMPSYFHKTIGGYSAVKMQRYQDLIDHQLMQSNQAVFNMLNTKYFIGQGQDGQPSVQLNPAALGNAWFVNKIIMVSDANAEMNGLNDFDPAGEAVVHREFESYVSGLNPSKNGTIKQTSYTPNRVEYVSETSSDQLAVFSEIWYGPNLGWQAYLDGQPVDHIRVDYLLRGMKIPSGKHTITFEFKPKAYFTGEKISLACSGLVILLFGFAVFKEFQSKKRKVIES